ncbi:MAG: hypothetical protein RBU25_06060 [Lentisphaeria bacterium]|jgi:hypothetical protein|nr:hypothetical protein [Lentisphaeria bacterium]
MSRQILFLLPLFLLAAGCAVLRDPSGMGVQDVHAARPQAKTRVVRGTTDDVYAKVRTIGTDQAWEVFREFPDEHLIVFQRIPGSVDTTQVGVFCSQAESGVLVEVSCQGVFSRELAARILFDRL